MKRKDRASVLIFCVILMAAVGTIVLTTADLGRTVYRRQALIERDAKFDYALDGLVAVYGRRLEYGDVIVPTTEAFDVGGLNFEVDLANGTGTRSRFVDLAVSLDIPGYARKRTYALGNRGKVSPTWFAFGSTMDFLPSAPLAVTGDAFFAGDCNLGSNTGSVTGSLFAQRATLTAGPTVTGSSHFGIADLTPSLDFTAYSAVATTKTSGNQSPLTVAFLPDGSYQSLWYNNGNVTLNSLYTGIGTIFVRGNLTIDKFERTLPSDQALIIVDGNVTITSGRFDGFIICDGQIKIQAAGGLVVNGAIWGNQFQAQNPILTVNFDSFFWDDPQWDKRMRVPGMW